MPASTNDSTTAGPGVLGGHRAGEHEDAGADDGADTQRRQVQRSQCALEAVIGRGFGLERGDALTSEQIHRSLAVSRSEVDVPALITRTSSVPAASRSRCSTLCFRP